MRLGIETGEHGRSGWGGGRSDLQLLLLAVQEHGPVAVTTTVPIAHSTYLARRARCPVGCPRTCSCRGILVPSSPPASQQVALGLIDHKGWARSSPPSAPRPINPRQRKHSRPPTQSASQLSLCYNITILSSNTFLRVVHCFDLQTTKTLSLIRYTVFLEK